MWKQMKWNLFEEFSCSMIFFLLTSISSGFAYICVSHEVAGLYVRSTEHHVMSEWMKMCVNCFCFAYFFINFLRNLLSLDYFSVYLLPQSLPFHTTMCVYFLYLSAAWHCATLDFWEKRGRNSMPFFSFVFHWASEAMRVDESLFDGFAAFTRW